MKCPDCGEAAYVGFKSIECTNWKCKHFEVTPETICPCCGIKGHFSPEGKQCKFSNQDSDVKFPFFDSL